MRHAHAVAGLPPAMPPIPPVLFVYALAGDDVSTAEGEGPRPRAHRQLGAWYGKRSYEGIILSFFKRAGEARAFVGGWGGHDRGLSIKASGRGNEGGNGGCCYRIYQMTFHILSVRGTLTRATALYRVTSFRRYQSGVRKLHVGEIGKLRLRNGIVTNTLTRDFFCSSPAWGATNACGL